MKKRSKYFLIVFLSVFLSVLLCQSRWGDTIDIYIYDILLKKSPPSPSPNHEVSIVAIDDDSLNQLKAPLVLWQGYFATVTHALAQAGAKAIIYDMIHAVSLDDFIPELDIKFMKAIKNAKERGIGVYLGFKAGQVGAQMPLPKFALMSSGLGFLNLYPDMDGKIRRQPLMFFTGKDRHILSLPLVGAMAYSESKQDPKAYLCEKMSLCADSTPSLLIDYRIHPESIKIHSFVSVLNDSQAGMMDKLEKDFFGKVVIVGLGTDKLPDNHSIPFNPLDRSGNYASGTVIHAITALSILSGSYLRELPFKLTSLLAVAFALFSSLFICFTPPTLWFMVLPAVLLVGAAIINHAFSISLVIPASPLLLGILAPTIVSGSFVYFMEYRQQRTLKKYFKSYVNSQVMKEIIENPESVQFEGKLLNFSIMFTDIRNFTTLSERLAPSEVVKGLNTYLTEMTYAIRDAKGYTNRFIGDGILAFFGAPNELPEHGALAAIKGGLNMLERLRELNKKEIFPGCGEIKIGIGIHTGEAIVGNVGCFEKMDYTVIGDSANLASRIESLTKNYSVPFLVTESTYNFVKDQVVAEYVDCIKVKGREKEVKIYKIHSIIEEEIQ